MKQYLEAGEIVNTHGIGGELRIMPWADSPEFLLTFSEFTIDGVCYKVEKIRVHKTCVLLKLAGIDAMEAAARMRGKRLLIDREHALLPDGAVFITDLIGLPVYADGVEIGKITDVLQRPGNDVYVVQGEHEYLIPAVKEFVPELDPEKGFLAVHLIEGMRTDEN